MDRPEERLALIECLSRDGRAVSTVDVTAWPVTIGRSLANHLVLDDPHVAPVHARIEADEAGAPVLVVLDAVNGVRIGNRRHRAGARCPLPADGAALQIGQARLKIRLPQEALATTRPLPRSGGPALLLALPLAGLAVASKALSLDPGAPWSNWLPTLLGLPVFVMGWCLAWALVSKVFHQGFDFVGHLRVALAGMLAVLLVDPLLTQAGAALGAPTLWRMSTPVQLLVAGAWGWAHLRRVLPAHRQAVGWGMAAFSVGALVLGAVLNDRQHDSWSGAPYMSTLPMPATRLSGTVPVSVLVQDMQGLAGPLSERAAQARAEDEEVEGQ